VEITRCERSKTDEKQGWEKTSERISTATPTKSIAPGLRCPGRGFSVIRLSPDRRYFQARGEQCILHNEAQIRRDLAFADATTCERRDFRAAV